MSDAASSSGYRSLRADERALAQWMLEHGFHEARGFLDQLPGVKVTPWRCQCGCASINFVVEGLPEPQGPMRPLADFAFDSDQGLSGIFIFAQGGTLGGIEVFGCGGDAPPKLPSPSELKEVWDPRNVFTIRRTDKTGASTIFREHVPYDEVTMLLQELNADTSQGTYAAMQERLESPTP